MPAAIRSMTVFAGYMVVLGAALVVAPNPLLTLFGFSTTTEPWIRLLGVLVLCLAGYYLTAARHRLLPFIRATVWGRAFVVACMLGLVAIGLAPPQLLLFAAIDAAGAAWTAIALRRERSA
jgi:hypothetical protein